LISLFSILEASNSEKSQIAESVKEYGLIQKNEKN